MWTETLEKEGEKKEKREGERSNKGQSAYSSKHSILLINSFSFFFFLIHWAQYIYIWTLTCTSILVVIGFLLVLGLLVWLVKQIVMILVSHID